MLWAQKASAIIRETKGGRPTIQRAGPLDDGPSTRRGRPTIQSGTWILCSQVRKKLGETFLRISRDAICQISSTIR
ncbi:hypothetical protein IAQ61_001629 [Plenodomus lingam]|uniref:uncharacterized protein n=1 Tax=Leptosphaeria maculans TaxID=5022 RepID=UPI00332C3297|nr:hypothetical protein IAQ61_001629 [Plenodomus lingam]